MGLIEKKELLWCLLCNDKFTIEDIEKCLYVAETGICTACYQRMARNAKICFGKETTDERYGYDEETLECKEFCPDRKACREFVQRRKRKVARGEVSGTGD